MHGHVDADVDDQFDAFDRGLQRGGRHRLVNYFAHIEVHVLELQAVGLDLGEVEHIVDQGEQRLGAAADDVDVFALGVVEAGFRQDLRHADDAVHGRADFVAQVGEEVALGAVGGFRRELGIEGGLLGVLAVRDELGGARDAQRRAIGRPVGLGARAHPFVVPGLVPHAKFHIVRGAALKMIFEREPHALAILRMHQGLEA